MFETRAERKDFVTGDGVRLSYLEAGSGPPLVMVHGWSQSAIMWHAQIERFSASHRVLALDLRGHGDSDKPEYGYRIARLAHDLCEFMAALDLEGTALMGHSLGCSVILSLWDTYGPDRIGRLILFDEGAYLCDNALLDPAEREAAGASLPADGWFGLAAGLVGPEGPAMKRTMLAAMFTPQAAGALVDEVVAQNLAFPRPLAARLLLNNVFQDWRDIFARITVPTFVIGAEASVIPARAMEWQASVIPDAAFVLIPADAGGSHFAFLENPDAFNAAVATFLGV